MPSDSTPPPPSRHASRTDAPGASVFLTASPSLSHLSVGRSHLFHRPQPQGRPRDQAASPGSSLSPCQGPHRIAGPSRWASNPEAQKTSPGTGPHPNPDGRKCLPQNSWNEAVDAMGRGVGSPPRVQATDGKGRGTQHLRRSSTDTLGCRGEGCRQVKREALRTAPSAGNASTMAGAGL